MTARGQSILTVVDAVFVTRTNQTCCFATGPGRMTSPTLRRRFFLYPVLLFAARALFAVEGADLFDLSMDQLSQVEIKSDIASVRAKTVQEQPGIVSVITAREIHETGARDLSDVLMLVPGYTLDSDVQSMVGLTFRGLQGQEGKVLVAPRRHRSQ